MHSTPTHVHAQLEKGMKNLAKLYAEQTGVVLTNMPGAGAAGGIGGAMCAFLKAKLLKVRVT